MDVSINKQNKINSDEQSSLNANCNILDIGLSKEIHLMELQDIQAFIAHKEHEVSVYENAKSLIECQATGERCMVFLGDNLFVLRTREQALEILERQINVFKNALKSFYQTNESLNEKVALLDRLSITNEGLVEIREPEKDGQSSGKIKGKRIEHFPKNSFSTKDDLLICKKLEKTNITKERDENYNKKDEDAQRPKKPQGLSEQDYEKFLKLVNSIESSDEEDDLEKNDVEDEHDNEDEELNNFKKEDEENLIIKNVEQTKEKVEEEEQQQGRRHVHFSDKFEEEEDFSVGIKKERSILKNKNEHSPIDSTELKKMNQKEQRRIYSVSKETVKDEIVERELTSKKNKKISSTKIFKNNKKQPKKEERRRPISQWKAQRDGFLIESEDDY